MRPLNHLISGIIFSLILFYFFPKIGIIGVALIIFSTFFIDTDHYLFYVAITKDLSLKNAYNWFVQCGQKWKKISKEEKKELRNAFYIFHGIEPLLLVLALAYFVHYLFYFILIGMALHIFLDLIVIFIEGYKLHKIFLIYDILQFEEKRLVHPLK